MGIKASKIAKEMPVAPFQGGVSIRLIDDAASIVGEKSSAALVAQASVLRSWQGGVTSLHHHT